MHTLHTHTRTPQVFDASVKLPTGVEHGSVYQFGNFDECMVAVEPAATAAPDPIVTDGSGSRNVAVQPQYCLAAVSAVGYSVRAGANRHFQVCVRRVNSHVLMRV